MQSPVLATIGLSVCLSVCHMLAEMRPALLYSDAQSVVGFSVIPKCVTLYGYFALNSVFAHVWLARTMRFPKNNCVKNNKDRHILSAAQILAGSLLSGNTHIRFVRIFARVL